MKGNSGSGAAAAEAGECDGADRQRAEGGGTAGIPLQCIQIEHGSSPVLTAHRASSACSLAASVPGNGFKTFASKAENGFVAVMNCFMTVSCSRRIAGLTKKPSDTSMTSYA